MLDSVYGPQGQLEKRLKLKAGEAISLHRLFRPYFSDGETIITGHYSRVSAWLNARGFKNVKVASYLDLESQSHEGFITDLESVIYRLDTGQGLGFLIFNMEYLNPSRDLTSENPILKQIAEFRANRSEFKDNMCVFEAFTGVTEGAKKLRDIRHQGVVDSGLCKIVLGMQNIYETELLKNKDSIDYIESFDTDIFQYMPLWLEGQFI